MMPVTVKMLISDISYLLIFRVLNWIWCKRPRMQKSVHQSFRQKEMAMLSGIHCSTGQKTLLLCTTLNRASLEEQKVSNTVKTLRQDTPSAYWKRADNIPFLGHLVSEVNQLLVKPLPSFHRAMSNARLSSLSVIRVHKHKEINFNEVISKFAGKKDRRLALSL